MLLADALLHLFAASVNTPRVPVVNGSAAFSDTPGYRVEKYPVGNCKSCYVVIASLGAMMADDSEIDRILAQYGPRPLPDVRPREMREAPLGQSNFVDRLLSMYGQPSLDALRRGFAGQSTPREIAETFLTTGPVGPFGMANAPLRAYHGTSEHVRRFDPSIRGETTGAQSARDAFWFTRDPRLASDYAVLAGNGPLATIERQLAQLENRARTGATLTAEETAMARQLYAAREAKLAELRSSGEAGAGMEGANVMPVDLHFRNPLVHDFRGQPYRDTSYADLVARARQEGRDGVVFRNTYDPAFPLNGRELTDVYGAIQPGTVRSATTGDVLYSATPMAAAGSILSQYSEGEPVPVP